MDLSQLDVNGKSEDGAVLHFKHPLSGELLYHEDKPMQVKLKGIESATFRNTKRSILANRPDDAGPELSDEEMAELYAACTIEFNHIVENEKLVNTKDAKKIYMHYAWMVPQILLFMADTSNFFTQD